MSKKTTIVHLSESEEIPWKMKIIEWRENIRALLLCSSFFESFFFACVHLFGKCEWQTREYALMQMLFFNIKEA